MLSSFIKTFHASTDAGIKTPIWGVTGVEGVYAYRGMKGSEATVDADGAPNAYGPDGLKTLDDLANARGVDGGFCAIVTTGDSDTVDKNGDDNFTGKPVVQGPNDLCPGYYVSTTSAVDGRYAETDPRRYADSTKIKYIAIPQTVADSCGMQLGDLAGVFNLKTGKYSWAVFADVSTEAHIGEISIALADVLGINSDARTGGQEDGVGYLLFPGTMSCAARPWPLTMAETGHTAYLFNVWTRTLGGAATLFEFFGKSQ
jgi:hypothetical protein